MAQQNTLDQKLDLYTQQNRTHKQRKKIDSSSLLGYSIAAGMAMMVPDAMAGIVHSTAGFSLAVATSGVSSVFNAQGWDIDGIGGADAVLSVFISSSRAEFEFRRGTSSSAGYAPYSTIGPLSIMAAGTSSSSLHARNLSPSNTVLGTSNMAHDAGGGFGSTGTGSNWSYYPDVYFANGSTGFIGLRFNGDTGTFGEQFAWVKIRFDVSGSLSNGTANATLTILEWAYDDSGAPIQVGAVSAVPLPGAAGLMLLGMGSIGLTALRKRKQQYLEKQQAKAEAA